MTHNEEQYDYTTETPNGTIERVSSQEQKESEADSNYFNNSSSGYFSYLNPLFWVFVLIFQMFISKRRFNTVY